MSQIVNKMKKVLSGCTRKVSESYEEHSFPKRTEQINLIKNTKSKISLTKNTMTVT